MGWPAPPSRHQIAGAGKEGGHANRGSRDRLGEE
jgi:hypothetical protein